jgi:DNA-binding MarR family transcriptional regulator
MVEDLKRNPLLDYFNDRVSMVHQQVLQAAEMVQHLAELHRRVAAVALAAFGASESGAGLIWLLGMNGPVPMGAVAQHLACDPSNVTLLATSLEGLGLAQRVADPSDRRRRLLQLTDRGRQAHAAMIGAVVEASPLSALSADDLRALVSALEPLTSPLRSGPPSSRS